jgi:hypothetical protein
MEVIQKTSLYRNTGRMDREAQGWTEERAWYVP